MKNNNNDLVDFRDPWDETVDKTTYTYLDEETGEEKTHKPYDTWQAAFESRYPDYDTQ